MTVLSRLLRLGGLGVRQLSRSSPNKSHHVNFEYQKELLSNRRALDIAHFYIVCLGFAPWGLAALIQAVMSGHCRLEPEPSDRVPRHWEYENTPLKQFRQWLINDSPQKLHEIECAFQRYGDIKTNFRWALPRLNEEEEEEEGYNRKRIMRMEHLTMQRLDYGAWYHQPVKDHWLEATESTYGRLREDYDAWAHQYHGAAQSYQPPVGL